MAGKRMGKHHCGYALTHKQCTKCRGREQVTGLDVVCEGGCGAVILPWCCTWVWTGERCLNHFGKPESDNHPSAPKDYWDSYTAMLNPARRAAFVEMRGATLPEMSKAIAGLATAQALETQAPDALAAAAKAAESAQRTEDSARRAKNDDPLAGGAARIVLEIKRKELPNRTVPPAPIAKEDLPHANKPREDEE